MNRRFTLRTLGMMAAGLATVKRGYSQEKKRAWSETLTELPQTLRFFPHSGDPQFFTHMDPSGALLEHHLDTGNFSTECPIVTWSPDLEAFLRQETVKEARVKFPCETNIQWSPVGLDDTFGGGHVVENGRFLRITGEGKWITLHTFTVYYVKPDEGTRKFLAVSETRTMRPLDPKLKKVLSPRAKK